MGSGKNWYFERIKERMQEEEDVVKRRMSACMIAQVEPSQEVLVSS